MQSNFAAGVLVNRIHDAGIEGPRINMKAHGTLSELARIAHVMHRVAWIDSYRVGRIDFHHVGGYDIAALRSQVLFDHAVVAYRKPTHRRSHPAVLVLVVVDGRPHAHLPTNRQEFIKLGFVDEVPSVVLPVPE